MDSENPFILPLSWLPFLLDRLSLNQNQSLSQRVVMRYQLTPLDKEEVKDYIEHNLKLAGANYEIFSQSVLEAITSRSRGWVFKNYFGAVSILFRKRIFKLRSQEFTINAL